MNRIEKGLLNMIKNQWYCILESKEVKSKKSIGVTRMGEKLVLWRSESGKVNCIFDKCCHRGAAISAGKVVHNKMMCPFHGFEYDSSGKVTLIPANGKNTLVPERYKVQSYLVEEKYDLIWLWYGEILDNMPEIPFFKELREGFSYGGFSEMWPVNYTRAIENQLDVVHLPFVHTSSIGRGNKTLVNGPVVKWEDNLMTFYVNNVVDNGKTKPLKPNEIKNYKKLFSLQLQMPNIWQNIISKDIRIVAIFAPIDENHTHIYLRFYQKFMKVPILKQIVNGMSTFSNKYILHQDRRIVLTQTPIKSELTMNENLIQGDMPIIEYRRRRAFLKGEIAKK
ncbi:aromatic ring-hydroxylating oxygenase subunit alpha [Clostridium estertheticum]|uniref:aromatic ring-hydroxylating oxygenase subunit alpha n=1 Tax=Clostridium estertheticum TaxID=238834 RepID=UPI001CF5B005|nr:aromatic ring-hydroxylating dioxygenase subunit alpha [Clostridium estertheticum]MCB2355734.1 aromatic ring-hydroxylating dioxygenase subunit alpha [Clostridium estertheticum]WAG39157.1 aromatic ring-hydroxylating dioxygenase subunit alpha [Clostridium estertheticum]